MRILNIGSGCRQVVTAGSSEPHMSDLLHNAVIHNVVTYFAHVFDICQIFYLASALCRHLAFLLLACRPFARRRLHDRVVGTRRATGACGGLWVR